MSEIRGKKGFESPSQQELDDYIRQSRESITQMKNGKPPLLFKPRKKLPFKIIGVMILIIISSSLMLGGSFLELDSGKNNNGDDTTTTTPSTTATTTTTIATTTTSMETTQPIDTEQAITTSIPQVEVFINAMIAPNHSSINPVVVNGTINRSQTISDLELFDLVWILSQFDENSEWWNLGRSLIFETYLLWNKTTYLTENLRFELLALRSLVAYSPENILLETSELETYQNISKQLWQNISSAYNNETGIFDPDNNTLVNTHDQILFSQVLAKTAEHPSVFNLSITQEIAIQLLETLNFLTITTDGLPESFEYNITIPSPIFYSYQQSEMILALNQLRSLLGALTIIDSLSTRLNNFLTNFFLQQDWSIAYRYNQTSDELSDKIFLLDQLFFIRMNILHEKRNFAEYTLSIVRSTFGTENSSYFTSNEDSENQFLIDHVNLLLTFEEFLKLEKTESHETHTSTTETEEPTGAAGYAWEFTIIITVLVYITYRRRKSKK